MRLSVVMPTLGGWELTRHCLDSLEPELRDGIIGEIIVVDDGSTDGSADHIAADPRVRPVLLPRNLGFAGASNAGAAVATGEAIFLLNNDTIVPRGTIATLARVLDDPAVGIVGPRLLYGDGTIQNAGHAFVRGQRLPWVLHYHLDGDLPDANVPREYPAVTGAAMLVRTATWRELGGIDDGYRNGCEDIDFCLRAWSRGWRVRYEPAATVIHLEGANLGKSQTAAANAERLIARWAPAIAELPQIEVGESPVVAITSSRQARGIDAFAAFTFVETARAGIGARVVAGSSRLGHLGARLLARMDRRDYLSIGVAASHARPDILVAAPTSHAQAAAFRAARAASYWAPTPRAVRLLRDAGVPPDEVRLTRLGVDAQRFQPGDRRTPKLALWVAGPDDPNLARVRDAVAGDDVTVDLITPESEPDELAAVLADSRVVLLTTFDPYDLVPVAALTAGCVVVTTPAVAADFDLADLLHVEDDEAGLFARAVHLARAGAPASRHDAIRRATIRRRSLPHAAARFRELARAHKHGPVDGSRGAMR